MFEVADRSAFIANVNFRAEKHGDENKTAVDIKIELDAHKSALSEFNPSIADFLFRDPTSGDQQRLEGTSTEDGAEDKRTALRVPRLAPLALDEKFPGYQLSIANGLGLKKPLELVADLSKFRFEAHEGGSVTISFNASGHPNSKQSSALVELIQEECEITLIAPKASEQHQAQADLADESNGREKVLIVAVDFRENKSKGLFTVTATTSDGKPIACDPVAYRPDQSNVTDLLRFKGYEPEFAPAVVAEAWPVDKAA